MFKLNQKIEILKISENIIINPLNEDGIEEIHIFLEILKLSISRLFLESTNSDEMKSILTNLLKIEQVNNILVLKKEELIIFKGVLDGFLNTLESHSKLPKEIKKHLDILNTSLKQILN